jgi:hypothetical protein
MRAAAGFDTHDSVSRQGAGVDQQSLVFFRVNVICNYNEVVSVPHRFAKHFDQGRFPGPDRTADSDAQRRIWFRAFHVTGFSSSKLSPEISRAKALVRFPNFCLKATIRLCSDELCFGYNDILADMTRLTIAEDPGKEFAIRGLNSITDSKDDEVIFYDDVTKVHVVPEPGNFTIQIITPDLIVEMDFADADSVREALEVFETKKVLEVNPDLPGSVRIIPLPEKTEEPTTYGEPFIKPESHQGVLEQMPSRPDERLSENLPDAQKG